MLTEYEIGKLDKLPNVIFLATIFFRSLRYDLRRLNIGWLYRINEYYLHVYYVLYTSIHWGRRSILVLVILSSKCRQLAGVITRWKRRIIQTFVSRCQHCVLLDISNFIIQYVILILTEISNCSLVRLCDCDTFRALYKLNGHGWLTMGPVKALRLRCIWKTNIRVLQKYYIILVYHWKENVIF